MAEQPPAMSAKARTSSISQASETSQTAAEFIREQLSLEQEAREALPYQFDTCTRDLGPLRQSLYACLTCNPPPASPAQQHTPAAVCYSCSISCHGEHTLVELFNKRNFICDCGTTRMPDMTPCSLRINSQTGQKGDVTGDEAAKTNKYNQNFQNKFCGCGQDYDAHQEKGTMFQCLGLGTCEEGGCGEDWWHPECLVGFDRSEYASMVEKMKSEKRNGVKAGTDTTNNIKMEEATSTVDSQPPSTTALSVEMSTSGIDGNDIETEVPEPEDDDPPLPPGFPAEDDFDHFICYKCVEANPWIKKYAGSTGFLQPVLFDKAFAITNARKSDTIATEHIDRDSKKRKASDDGDQEATSTTLVPPISVKRQRSEDPSGALSSIPEDKLTLPITPKKQEVETEPKHSHLPPLSSTVQTTPFSLFLLPDFRDHLCRCAECFPQLKTHPQLLEEEETYEPPISEDGEEGAQSVGTGSLLDRGEAAFNNMDRVRAIQGAMAYAHLKDKVSAFLKPFAESGQAVGAEDVKAYFEKLRGDEQGIQAAAGDAKASRAGDETDDVNGSGKGNSSGGHRKDQSGY